MKKILAFGGSNSQNSINKTLAVYAAKRIEGAEVITADLNDYDLPLCGIDLENEIGIPKSAQDFLELISTVDGVVLSLAEHNGAYSVAFKNIFDWMSRINGKLWQEKPMLLMATSPGGRGGATVLEIAKNRFPYMGGNIVATFSLPSFGQNFSEEGISDAALQNEFDLAINQFSQEI